MLRFKDMFPVEYRPGEDELINYRAIRRKRTIGVGEGGPIGEETEVDEALSMQDRLKRSRQMKKYKSRIAMGRKRAMRKFANMDTLKKRARKSAYKALYKKLSKNVSKDDMTAARKAEIEKRLNTPAMKSRIERMARKALKDVRKAEMDRKR